MHILASETSSLNRPEVQKAISRIASRLQAQRNIGSRFGTSIETALATRALLRLSKLQAPDAILNTLIDLQAADGGFPADPFFRTVPHQVTTHYGSRAVTTAIVINVMTALRAQCEFEDINLVSDVENLASTPLP